MNTGYDLRISNRKEEREDEKGYLGLKELDFTLTSHLEEMCTWVVKAETRCKMDDGQE